MKITLEETLIPPSSLLPATWLKFLLEVEADSPEVKCSECGQITWYAWRTGFCLLHRKSHNFNFDWKVDESLLTLSDLDFSEESPILEEKL